MPKAFFKVTRAGPLVTIQDAGRKNMMRFGVPASGPMDRGSFDIANAALGNQSNKPAIEISIGGLTLECIEGAVTIAIAGGGFHVEIDGNVFPSWIVTTIRARSHLTIKSGLWGSWTYLAFAGQMQAKAWLGSLSTHGPSGLGGGKIITGQILEIADAAVHEMREGEIPCPVSARPRNHLNVVLGPQDRFFAPDAIEALFSNTFVLSDSYDRMGVRLVGPAMKPTILDMPSEPIVRGSIQVAGDGVATVLLADHQTTGGYPKIATIISDHIDGFVQLRSRQKLAFVSVKAETAIQSLRSKQRMRQQFLEGIKGRHYRSL